LNWVAQGLNGDAQGLGGVAQGQEEQATGDRRRATGDDVAAPYGGSNLMGQTDGYELKACNWVSCAGERNHRGWQLQYVSVICCGVFRRL